jgi:phage baseplate assembly protein W
MANEFDIDVDGTLKIDFGATSNQEILQNVAMILNSVVYSCPMDRSFAWDASLLDRPINLVPSLLSARLIAAVNKYEPRATITKVSYSGDASNGQLQPKVMVKIKNG